MNRIKLFFTIAFLLCSQLCLSQDSLHKYKLKAIWVGLKAVGTGLPLNRQISEYQPKLNFVSGMECGAEINNFTVQLSTVKFKGHGIYNTKQSNISYGFLGIELGYSFAIDTRMSISLLASYGQGFKTATEVNSPVVLSQIQISNEINQTFGIGPTVTYFPFKYKPIALRLNSKLNWHPYERGSFNPYSHDLPANTLFATMDLGLVFYLREINMVQY